MGNQIFLGLWGRDFIGSKFILNINFNKTSITQMLEYTFLGM